MLRTNHYKNGKSMANAVPDALTSATAAATLNPASSCKDNKPDDQHQSVRPPHNNLRAKEQQQGRVP
jgi:hypothetical protein